MVSCIPVPMIFKSADGSIRVTFSRKIKHLTLHIRVKEHIKNQFGKCLQLPMNFLKNVQKNMKYIVDSVGVSL